MKVYICFNRGFWGEEYHILGIYAQKQDAIDMAKSCKLDIDDYIEEREVIE